MDVSVIIVNYNTLEMTRRCIDSLFRETHDITFEVILVDNASTDGSKDFFSQDSRIKYIYNDVNLGFGVANNIGYKYSKGNYIFLLNSDTELINNAIYIMHEYIIMDSNIGALGGILYDINKNETCSYGHFPNLKDILCGRIKGILKRILNIKNHPSQIECIEKFKDVDFVSGADLLMPRKVIEDVGFFDEQFFLYYEETDLQYRMKLKKYKRRIIRGPEIYHLEKASVNNGKNSYSKHTIYMNRSLMVYVKKHYSAISFSMFKIIYIILQIPHLLNIKYPLNYKKELINSWF